MDPRTPGEIEIRTHDGLMVVKPVAANTIAVSNRTYIEEAIDVEEKKQKAKKRARRMRHV